MNRLLKKTIIDIVLIVASFYIAILIRFFGSIPNEIGYKSFLFYVFIFTIVKLIIYHSFKFHKIIWHYANITDVFMLIVVSVISNSILLLLNLMGILKLPNSIFIITALLDIVLLVIFKFYSRIKVYFTESNDSKTIKVLIVGAGEAGALLTNDIKKNNKLKYEAVGIVDDNVEKLHKIINGVEVLGTVSETHKIFEKYDIDKVVIAIPSLSRSERTDLIEKMNIPFNKISTVPSLREIVEFKEDITKIKNINIQDLLGREEIILDIENTARLFNNKVVLVSGGGGSIGSELARQIASMSPKKLILIDIYENSVYEVQNYILENHSDIDLEVLIDSIRDKSRIDEIFNKYKPNIVLHAAAHKHVPLMEKSPQSAVLNNVFGTHNMVIAAHNNNVDIFLQISTDKAVNPTNIMGATKRIDEMIVTAYDSISATKFTCVRFGNVLGSNGSVVPIFKKQIEKGGPVTVTDEKITRFFMTIPEACSLVLESATKSNGGEIFILDMGEPVKIIDLAKNMIRLYGNEIDREIKIDIIGLRPGEKLYEEFLVDKNNSTKTDNEKIFIEERETFDYQDIEKQLKELKDIVLSNDTNSLIEKLKLMVPTFNHKANEE